MRIIKDITEDEMIAEFLKGEINSKRFRKQLQNALKKLGENMELIKNPNLKSAKQNALRKKLLGKYRGYGKNRNLFENFPENVDWKWALLSSDELREVKYIDYSYWNKISSETRSPAKAAENIQKGLEVYGSSNEKYLRAAEYLKEEGVFPPLILVTKSINDRLVVLEGHLRLTAYFLVPKFIPKKVDCIVGISKMFKEWDLY